MNKAIPEKLILDEVLDQEKTDKKYLFKPKYLALLVLVFLLIIIIVFFYVFTKIKQDTTVKSINNKNIVNSSGNAHGDKADHSKDNQLSQLSSDLSIESVKEIIAKHEKEIGDIFDQSINHNTERGDEEFEVLKKYKKGLITENEAQRQLYLADNGPIQDYLSLFSENSISKIKYNDVFASYFFSNFSNIKEGVYTGSIERVDNYQETPIEVLKKIEQFLEIYKTSNGACEFRVSENSKDEFDDLSNLYSFMYETENLGDVTNCKELKIRVINRPAPNYPFAVTSDNRIRFYSVEEVVPYDLIFENGEWKIDADISIKYVDKIHYVVETLEKIKPRSFVPFRAFELLELINGLTSYNSKYGYFPEEISDLFPDFYLYKDYLNEDSYAYKGFKYAISSEKHPQDVHVSIRVAVEAQPNKILSIDSDFNSRDIYMVLHPFV